MKVCSKCEVEKPITEFRGLKPPRGGSRSWCRTCDHDHQTGAIRGLLCARCNKALGLLQENIDTVEAAAAYLRSFAVGTIAS